MYMYYAERLCFVLFLTTYHSTCFSILNLLAKMSFEYKSMGSINKIKVAVYYDCVEWFALLYIELQKTSKFHV